MSRLAGLLLGGLCAFLSCQSMSNVTCKDFPKNHSERFDIHIKVIVRSYSCGVGCNARLTQDDVF